MGENNIFEGVRFGTKFLRKDGKIAICCNHNDASTILWAEGEYEPYEYQNDRNGFTDDSPSIDIISRYQEPIDEEKLNRLAKDESFTYGTCYADVSHSVMANREGGFFDGFIAGYMCKANEGYDIMKEEIIKIITLASSRDMLRETMLEISKEFTHYDEESGLTVQNPAPEGYLTEKIAEKVYNQLYKEK